MPTDVVLQWTHCGLNCLIRYVEHMGTYNGYVGVPIDHPYFEQDYHSEGIENLEVHGGVTYTGFWEDLNDGLWYIGFDTAHYTDITPIMDSRLPKHLRNGEFAPGTAEEMISAATQFYKAQKNDGNTDPFHRTYKREGYVKNECEKLAEQLSKVQKRHR